jgi:hypothetical protein
MAYSGMSDRSIISILIEKTTSRRAVKSPTIPQTRRGPICASRRCNRNVLPLANLCRGKEEPSSAFGFVDPILDQTGRGDIVVFVTDFVRFAEQMRQLLIVGRQFGEHLQRRDEIGVVVLQPLMLRNVIDRMQARCPDFAGTLRNIICHRKDLVRLFIEQQVVIAKVRAAHVPMKVLRLDVECEHIGQQAAQLFRDGDDTFGREVRRRGQDRVDKILLARWFGK